MIYDLSMAAGYDLVCYEVAALADFLWTKLIFYGDAVYMFASKTA